MVLPPPWNSRPNSKVIYMNSPPLQPPAGTPRRRRSRPITQNFTGKCGTPKCTECYTRPACKSGEKSKGTQNLKSCDVALDQRLIAG
ncbi:hypothetical protein MRB53_035011 [Persea americana]|uniref:Uncharacterized protein n=1 Tax=Persea americana TaxID=3435 RepID=A0ACC2K3D9_PERAE|nr:hypothetical protein MRB53_035011 [Persea americana]